MNLSELRLILTQAILAATDDEPTEKAQTKKEKKESPGIITWAPVLFQPMDQSDAANWEKANWSNGDPFACTWRPDHVSFNSGLMTLSLDNRGCPSACDDKPFVSGEYRTKAEKYFYGYYEARIKAAKGDGLVTSFFTYCGVYGTPTHHEIDIEFLGKDSRAVQLNYYVEGRGNHEQMIDLPFDASADFHNYGFAWTDSSLAWYVDGRQVRIVKEDRATVEREIPFKAGKIMMNFWPGTAEVDGWLNHFNYTRPLQAQYDWIKYSPLDNKDAPEPKVAPKQAEPKAKTVAPKAATQVSALKLETIQKGSFGFNGGQMVMSGAKMSFSAKASRDPGFGVFTGNAGLAGRQTVKFEIKGSLTRLGNYARFIAQVYDDQDNDSQPTVSLDPIALSADFKTVTIDLDHQVDKVKKIQFLLVTDKGSCQVEIKNLRFE